MPLVDWVKEFSGAVAACDRQGIIVDMNEKAVKVLSKSGLSLVGRNVLDCHPEPARSKLAKMLSAPVPNTYTIEKNGIKKLIHQAPWQENGEYKGFVEISIEIPSTMPHHIRAAKTSA